MDLQQKQQHWLAILSQQKNSGLTITQFCSEHKINISTFYAWRKKIANHSADKLPAAKMPKLVPLMIHDASFITELSLSITTPNGYQLNFNERLSPANLAAFLKVLP
jgi:transposase-like protein